MKLKWSNAMSMITANAVMEKDPRVPLTTEDYDSDLEGEDGKLRYSNRYNKSPEGTNRNKPKKSSIKRNSIFVRIRYSCFISDFQSSALFWVKTI